MSKYRQVMRQILAQIPQLEEPELSDTQKLILEFLKQQEKPLSPKEISQSLNIGIISLRGRLSELMQMGFIYQPNKTEQLLSEISNVGFCNVSSSKKSGYSILKLRA